MSLFFIDVCVYFIACAPLAQFGFAWLRFRGVSVSLDGKTGCPSSVCHWLSCGTESCRWLLRAQCDWELVMLAIGTLMCTASWLWCLHAQCYWELVMYVVRAVMRLLPLSILHELKDRVLPRWCVRCTLNICVFILHFHIALAGIRNKRRANVVRGARHEG